MDECRDSIGLAKTLKKWSLGDCNVLKFRDRNDAGNALAQSIEKSLASERTDIVVIGIPRGGVVLADIVAGKLGADFDIVIPRKLGAPGNDELAVGAVMQDGTAYINEYLVRALRISPDYLASEKLRQAMEINRRSGLYRNPAIPYRIGGRVVVLVDDGVATGATIMASAEWLRKQGPTRLVVGVPVAPVQSVSLLESAADSVAVLTTPRDFGSVGQFYEDFAPVTDEQVMTIMKSRLLL
jgi:putative phosphoribosyl transferase